MNSVHQTCTDKLCRRLDHKTSLFYNDTLFCDTYFYLRCALSGTVHSNVVTRSSTGGAVIVY